MVSGAELCPNNNVIDKIIVSDSGMPKRTYMEKAIPEFDCSVFQPQLRRWVEDQESIPLSFSIDIFVVPQQPIDRAA